MKKLLVVLAVVVAVVIAVIVLNRSKSDGKDVRIGAILPLTGDAGSYGTGLKKGMDVALDGVNAQGGINGKKLVMVVEDSQADPAKAVNAFNKLRSVDRVPMVLGDMFSAGTLAIAPIAERNKIVLLSPSASAVDLTKAGDYIFRIYPSDTYDGTYLAQFAHSKAKAKTVAIVYMQVASISAIVQVFQSEFEKSGGKVVCAEAYKEGDTDFRSQLAKATASNPDMIFIPGYLKEMANLLKQAKELGVKTPFLSISTFADPKILELAGDAAEGVQFSSPAFDAKSAAPEMQAFVGVFRKNFNQEPDILAGYGYDVVNIAAQALRSSGEITSDNIKQALYGIKDYPGVTGVTTFDSNGDVVKQLRMMCVKNGAFAPLP
ncbi:MAG: ABC transporter substrate-binding protein [Candidatus Hydrogenedentes bacterium]|nr:ABC transporter substrate-binding protein [Candidatus Hydrogenedentota bacterium]